MNIAGELRIFWRGVGTFLIRQGREILIEPEPDAEEALVRLFLLGPLLGILLHQRGVLVLHASVVSVNGYVVGFMGEKGWGKSTTAAAFNAKGHALVTDDILAVVPGMDGAFMVQPGPPQFKLWPEAAAASFGDDPETLMRLHSRIEKRERSANTGHIGEPLPLRRLYILDRGEQLECIPMSPAAALLSLVRHSYLSGIMKSLGSVERNFRQCAQLAEQVPVSSLKRPKDLGALGSIVELVKQDIGVVEREAETEMVSEAR
ncbi:MAG TPA: hypothetical protein VL970_03450 [Candidatus Acidoferrales bacterium]|nr:hypothetical protein [Candidatus Acidoferrales bacterium]